MQNLSRDKIRVQVRAYVVLGIFLFWLGMLLGVANRVISTKEWVSLCLLIIGVLPVVNLVLMLILWRAYLKAGKVYPLLVRFALLAAFGPLVILVFAN